MASCRTKHAFGGVSVTNSENLIQLELLVDEKQSNSNLGMMKSNLIFFLATFMGLVLLINSNPLPADGASDDYGDFNGTAAEISNKKRPANNKTSSGTGYNDEDPIGDIVGDILAGAGFLVSTGIGLIQGVASGEKKLGDTVEEAVKIGMNATHEAARIGVNVVSAAPKILEEKAQFVQGLGKTVEEHGGRVKQVADSIANMARSVNLPSL